MLTRGRRLLMFMFIHTLAHILTFFSCQLLYPIEQGTHNTTIDNLTRGFPGIIRHNLE